MGGLTTWSEAELNLGHRFVHWKTRNVCVRYREIPALSSFLPSKASSFPFSAAPDLLCRISMARALQSLVLIQNRFSIWSRHARGWVRACSFFNAEVPHHFSSKFPSSPRLNSEPVRNCFQTDILPGSGSLVLLRVFSLGNRSISYRALAGSRSDMFVVDMLSARQAELDVGGMIGNPEISSGRSFQFLA